MSERQVVIVAYKPKPGKEPELHQVTREHLPILRAEGLATERVAIVGLAADGTVVEVFEWEAGGSEKRTPTLRYLRYGSATPRYPSTCR